MYSNNLQKLPSNSIFLHKHVIVISSYTEFHFVYTYGIAIKWTNPNLIPTLFKYIENKDKKNTTESSAGHLNPLMH